MDQLTNGLVPLEPIISNLMVVPPRSIIIPSMTVEIRGGHAVVFHLRICIAVYAHICIVFAVMWIFAYDKVSDVAET